ncbi:MAG: hypothetical protein IE917_17675, partial [Betaproteobacteria bacterium]|nr:hypothetical protein [Betaproteobacteria bacterium]
MSYRPAEIQPGYGKRPSRGFDPWIAIAFLYPLTQLVWFDFFGQFYLTDFAGLALLLMMVQMPDARRRLGDIRFVLFLLGLWLFGQVATDLYRATSPENFLRGWGRIVFFGLQIVALWLFLPRKREYMIAYAFGLGIASIVGVPAQYEEYGWKFGYGFGLELIIAAATCLTVPFFGSLRRYAPWIFLAAAVLLLLKDARSMFAMSVIAGGICALALTLEKFPRLQKRINPLVFVSFLLVGIAATSLIATVYA